MKNIFNSFKNNNQLIMAVREHELKINYNNFMVVMAN